jgi:hypothetical protein
MSITTYLSGNEQFTNLENVPVLKMLEDVNKMSNRWIIRQHLVQPSNKWWMKTKKKVMVYELYYRLTDIEVALSSCNEYQVINFYRPGSGIYTLADIGEIAAYLLGLLNGYDEFLMNSNQGEVNIQTEHNNEQSND